MFYGGYAKNPTKLGNGEKVMIKPTIEEILKLLIDKETKTSQTAADQKGSSTRAFGAKEKKKKESARPSVRSRDSSSNKSTSMPARHCDTCFSNRLDFFGVRKLGKSFPWVITNPHE